jgi:two-component system, NtrC family, sensor kinase
VKKKHEPHTTLRQRMTIHIGLMVICSLSIGVGAFLGINSLQQNLGVAIQGYRQLRQVYEVGFQVALAKQALDSPSPDVTKALAAMQTAQLKLELSSDQTYPNSPPYWLEESKRKECSALLRQAIIQLKRPAGADASVNIDQVSAVNDVLGEMSNLSSEIRTTIAAKQEAASSQRDFTLILIGALSAGVVVIATAVGVRQYRSVVSPLDRLGNGVRRFAAGRFSERIEIEADQEFAALANDFNYMADELESLYKDLERKVKTKSKELVRSERLASVGYLAAGVAHEINNPLSIITGYGERSLELLDRGMSEATLRRTQKTIKIICEEAFRCKDITDRLLSLARPGTDERRPVSLPEIAQDVIRNIGGLPEYASRRITLESDSEDDFTIVANNGEMKQVLINLLVNALEAVQPGVGHVEVAVARMKDEVELAVTDNGRGMTSATLDRVFEPFFTDKRSERPGVGLGLSITHAIVADHGGWITADSDGTGCGSRFTLRLPAARKGAEHARC